MPASVISDRGKALATLALVIVCSGIMVLDSIIVRIYANIPKEPPIFASFLLFVGLFVFLALSNYFLIRSLRKNHLLSAAWASRFSKFSQRSIILIQFVLCGLIGAIAIELVIFGSYHLFILTIVLYMSYTTAAGYLLLISYQFLHSFKRRRNYSVLLYGVAFSLLVMNMVLSIPYLVTQLSMQLSNVGPIVELRPIRTTIFTSFQSSTTTALVLGTIYDYSSATAFFLIWVSAVSQLRTYAVRVGRAKYWIMVASPIVFYMFPVVADDLGIFDALRLDYGSEFNLIYTIVFSPYKQVGGILFGIVFWSTAVQVKQDKLRMMLQIAGTGMILLLGSTVLHGLSYFVAPPFGIITVSFMGIAAYMLSIGIFSSSKELSRNALIRKELYRITGEKDGLLKNTTLAEIENELNRKVKPIMERIRAEEQNSPQNISEVDTAEIITEVLKELESVKKGKKDN